MKYGPTILSTDETYMDLIREFERIRYSDPQRANVVWEQIKNYQGGETE